MNQKFKYVILSCFFFTACTDEKQTEKLAPPEMEVVSVLQQDVLLESEYSGQTFGESDIDIAPRVTGILQSIDFKEGTIVKQGDLLYTIDPLQYQAKVDEAAGKVAEAQTYLTKAKADLDMIEPLAKINAVSQRELVSAKALYEAGKGKLQSAEAGLRNAQIELGYCRIVAPISGLIGISKVSVGDFIAQGPFAKLNTISELKTIRVRFTISEQEYLRISKELNSKDSQLKTEASSVRLILSNGEPYSNVGRLNFADREIDPSTGAITIEASFDNPEQRLRPGQYVKVRIITHVEKDALLIPQRAVSEIQGIYKVLVVNDSNKVNVKMVQTGSTYNQAIIITEGLKAGERLALGGTALIKNASVISPKPMAWSPNPSTNSQ